MVVLITGVAGLLGSKLADWILENRPGTMVVGIDHLRGGYIENVNRDVMFIQDDLTICDLNSIFQRTNPDYVFHFAAYAAEGLSPFMRMFNYQNNMLSTANVINACVNHKVKRLVYTSSSSVYGTGMHLTEDSPVNPLDPYAISKYACEKDIQITGLYHDLDWCIIRPHNVYGDKQNIWDMYRNVLGIWTYKVLHNLPISIYGSGDQIRSFSFIDDCLPCLWEAATGEKASKQIINLGGKTPTTIKEASEVMMQIALEYGFGNVRISYLESRCEAKVVVPSWKKSEDLLGFEDRTDLYTGLKKMFRWAIHQPDREIKKWSKYEISQGIYSYWK